ncbi:hypothetical protein [Tardiphaga robiniae]|uniref:hypothetical protein n=1 Tax=Tardiphaga robiniae TaxID=943830 RepID=UPI001835E95C|nr:hypothetical protein [Tardiphaga robiniae]NUU44496.1 hypothetical protein [Tardiphaga robiniae]
MQMPNMIRRLEHPYLASSFNDQQLRHQALKLKDPYDQPNLTFEMPDRSALLDIINIYTFDKYPAKKAFCVLCQSHRHRKGFTAVLTSGQRMMCGSKCGADHFGTSWADAEKRIEERADRQFELKRVDRLAACERSFDIVSSWIKAFEQIENRRRAFHRLGEMASRVYEAALHKGGALTVFKALPQHADAEDRRRSLGGTEVTVGRIVGSRYLTASEYTPQLSQVSAAIAEMLSSARGSERLSTDLMRKRRRAFERSIEGLDEAAEVLEAARSFWTVENFSEMVRYINEHGATSARYELSEGVVRTVSGSAGMKVSMPVPNLNLEMLQAVRDYRRAD